MTLKEAQAQVRDYGYNLRKEEGEYQIKPQGSHWHGPHTYYAADLDDAVGTACAERKREAERVIRKAHAALGPNLGGSYTDLLCDNLPVSVAVAQSLAAEFELDWFNND